MGQRANLVVVRDGDWRLYYDHWCANRLDVELFWGPDLAAAFVEARRPCADRTEWLDEVWCEGGVVLDADRRTLVWFGGESVLWDVPLRRAHAALMGEQWPGWVLRWAAEGVVDLGRYVGVPVDALLATNLPDSEYAFRLWAEYPEENDMLLTVRRRGRTAAAQVAGSIASIELGESQLPALLELAAHPSLAWTGDFPKGGLHVDADEKRLFYWYADAAPDVRRRVGVAWPGWRTGWLADRFEEHLRLACSGVELPHRDPADLERDVLARLRASCTHHASNPAREMLARQQGTLNPLTDEGRGSVGSEAEKHRILDELEARIRSRR